jgi:hypothetical protein
MLKDSGLTAMAQINPDFYFACRPSILQASFADNPEKILTKHFLF